MKAELLRIEVVSPANLGSSFGLPTLDRPTQKDGWHGLPFLPDSALKGVLAGGLGEHLDRDDAAEESDRERRFGSPDRGDRPGRPARLVLGNGELLCFPLPTRGGGRAWVFPAVLALKHLELERGASGTPPSWMRAASSLLGELERESGKDRRVLAAGEVPKLLESKPLWARSGAEQEAVPLLAALARLAGPTLPRAEPWIVAGSPLVAELWRQATERRTLTAIDGSSRTVRSGSLRTVELIPVGSLFLSLLTAPADADFEGLDALIQLGAWESCGLGWAELSRVKEPGAAAPPAVVPGGPAVGAAGLPMRDMFAAVKEVDARDLRDTARAAVYNFGPRARLQGLGAAIAFVLAKAQPRVKRPKPEAVANRWLCRHLLGFIEPELAKQGEDQALLRWLAGDPFAPGRFAEQEEAILERWRWLRRHAELRLERRDGSAGASEPQT